MGHRERFYKRKNWGLPEKIESLGPKLKATVWWVWGGVTQVKAILDPKKGVIWGVKKTGLDLVTTLTPPKPISNFFIQNLRSFSNILSIFSVV